MRVADALISSHLSHTALPVVRRWGRHVGGHVPALLTAVVTATLCDRRKLTTSLTSRYVLNIPDCSHPLMRNSAGSLPIAVGTSRTGKSCPSSTIFANDISVVRNGDHLRTSRIRLRRGRTPKRPRPMHAISTLNGIRCSSGRIVLGKPGN